MKYLGTTSVEMDAVTKKYVDDASSKGNTAYGWGNHANAGYLKTHQDISGKQDKITTTNKLSASLVSGLATVATSGKYSDLSGTPTIPTTLPASDVYAWAKAATKPSYSWSEITGTVPTWNQNTTGSAGSAGRLSANSVSDLNSPTWGADGAVTYGAYSGTASNKPAEVNNANFVLTMNVGKHNTSGYYGWQISGMDYEGHLFARKFSAGAFGTWKRFAFTDGSVATASKLSADAQFIFYAHNANEINFGGTNTSTSIYIGYRAMDSRPIPTKYIFGGSNGSAEIVAAKFTGALSGNAATATALATSRSIWGQSFNGSTDISGALYLENNSDLYCKSSDGGNISMLFVSSSNTGYFGYSLASNNLTAAYEGGTMLFRTGTSHTERMRITTDGNVGIGTTTPSEKLYVNGNISLGNNANGGYINLLGKTNVSYNYKITNQEDCQLGLKFLSGYQNNTVIFSYKGDVIASGNVTAYSDRRLKSQIQDFEYRGALSPKTYIKDGRQEIGFIAQDVRELYPELVMGNETENDFLSLNYGAITAVLAYQTNDLDKRVKALEAENERLKEMIVELQK